MRISDLPFTRAAALTVALAPGLGVALGACAGANAGVSARSLLDTTPPAGSGEAAGPDAALDGNASDAEGFIAELVHRIQVQSCAVHTAVAFRDELYDAVAEREIADLDRLSRALCDAGVRRASAGWAATGEFELDGGPDGRILQGTSAFIFEDFEDFTVSARRREDGESRCGGVVAAEPDISVYPVAEIAAVARVEGVENGFILVRDRDGNEDCVQFGADIPSEVRLNNLGPYELWVGSLDEETDSWDIVVEPLSHGPLATRTWSLGDVFSVPVGVGPYSVRSPEDDYQYCSGYIAEQPTISVFIAEQAYGTIRVDSDADPVLVLRGPNGELHCNDDYNGVNPLISFYTSPGVWDVYVGSFSQMDEFGATLWFE